MAIRETFILDSEADLRDLDKSIDAIDDVGDALRDLEEDGERAERGTSRAGQALEGLRSSAQRAGGFLADVGKKVALAGVGAAAAAGAVVTAGLREFSRFEEGMNEVFTLMPGISEEAMGQMREDVRTLASDMGILPDDAIPALYQALSAGVPRENVFDFMETATKASIAGGTELETAVDGITSVVNAYGEEILSAQEASDLMFTGVRLGKTTFDEMSASLFNVVPTASALGVGFDQITASIATLTAQGTPTSVATTQMRAALNELADSGKGVGEIFQQVSGESFREFIEGGGDMGQAMTMLQDEADRLGVDVNQLFSSVEAGNFSLALTGEGAERFAENLDEMGQAAGATDAAFGQMDQGMARTMDRIRAKWSVALGRIGELFAPLAERGLDAVSGILDAFSTLLTSDLVSSIVGHFSMFFEVIDKGMSPIRAFQGLLGDLGVPRRTIDSIKNTIRSVRRFGERIGDLIGRFRDFVQSNPQVIAFLRIVAESAGMAIGIIVALAVAFAILTGGLGALGAIAGVVLSPLFLIVAALTALGVAYRTNFLGFGDAVREVVGRLGEAFGRVREFVSGLVDAFKSGGLSGAVDFVRDNLITPVADAITGYIGSGQLWEDARSLGSSVIDAVKDGISTAVGFATLVFDEVVKPLADQAIAYVTSGELWDNVKSIGGSILDALGEGVEIAGGWINDNVIQPLAEQAITYVSSGQLYSDAREVGRGILTAMAEGIRLATELATFIYDNVIKPLADQAIAYVSSGELWDNLRGIGGSLFSGLADGVVIVGTWIFDNVIKPLADQAITYVSSGELWDNLKDIGGSILSALVDGLVIGGTWIFKNIIKPLADQAITYVSSGELWDNMVSVGTGVFNALKDGFPVVADWLLTNIIQPIIDYFTIENLQTLWDQIMLVGGTVWDKIKEAFPVVADWLMENIIQPFIDFFSIDNLTALWDSVLAVGGAIMDKIGEGISNGIAAVEGIIKRAINQIVPDNIHIAIPSVTVLGETIGGGDIDIAIPQPFPGFQFGTSFTGFGPLDEIAGVVHRREAVVPADGMRVVPSPSGLMLQGGMGGGPVLLQPIRIELDGRVIYETVVEHDRRRPMPTLGRGLR